MELRHPRYFVAVAEELSFTAAAARLRLAQPSLTRQIKNLEEELRVQLFSRDKKRIALTEQGQFFLERTRRLLAQSALDVLDVRRRGPTGNGGGSLNIGYAADLHYNLLPGALGALRKIWPDVSLNLFDLTVAEQIRAFGKDKLDLSFVREARLPSRGGAGSASRSTTATSWPCCPRPTRRPPPEQCGWRTWPRCLSWCCRRSFTPARATG